MIKIGKDPRNNAGGGATIITNLIFKLYYLVLKPKPLTGQACAKKNVLFDGFYGLITK